MFKDLGQFKAYLRKINNFDELYIIQQGGRNISEQQMISRLQKVLKLDSKNIFNSNAGLFKNLKNKKGEFFIEDLEDFELFIKSSEFKNSAIAKVLKTTS